MATPNDIYNEITRIDNAKQGIAEAIEEKGVQVPDGTPIQDFPGKVRQIQTGSPYAVLYTPQDLTPEQQEQARQNIGATAPEIFVAIYGETTFDEVKAAYHAGKLCVCDRNGDYYVFAIWQGDDAACYFSCGMTGRIFYLRLSPNNTWFNSSYIFQQTSDKSQSIETDRESTTKYPSVKAVADALGKWGVISQTHTWTGSDAVGWDNVVSDQVWGIIPQNNIDLFEVIGAIFNDTGADITRQDIFGYDIIHKNGCFYLEGLGDISYNEMLVIYEHRWAVNQLARDFAPNPAIWSSSPARYGQKTFYHNWNTPVNIYQIGAYSPRGLEVINLLSKGSAQTVYLEGVRQCFYQTKALKRVYPFLDCSNCKGTGATYNAFYDSFNSCYSLEEIRLKNVKINVPITKSSRLSLASIVYLVSNAANTTAITIKLHATAYARCQADTTEYEYNGQTYTGILAYATARNISIVSA